VLSYRDPSLYNSRYDYCRIGLTREGGGIVWRTYHQRECRSNCYYTTKRAIPIHSIDTIVIRRPSRLLVEPEPSRQSRGPTNSISCVDSSVRRFLPRFSKHTNVWE